MTTGNAQPATAAPRSHIREVAVHLPADTLAVADWERELARDNPETVPAVPMVHRMTGISRVRRMPSGWQASDLAVAAARDVLDRTGLAAAHIDQLIFASASQDMIEPATAHIVAAKLGITAPVMDVKNACNSVLNAIDLADAMIATGRANRILIVSGESPSRAIRTSIPDRDTYRLSAPGFTMSDAGAALVLESLPAEAGDQVRGILATHHAAVSTKWDVGMLPTGGSVNPRDPARSYFEIDGTRLREAFLALGPQPVHAALATAGVRWDDVALICVHQVALTYLDDVFGALGVPSDRTVVTIGDHGNVASVSLPLQLRLAADRGMIERGDLVVLIGLAGGISIGTVVLRW